MKKWKIAIVAFLGMLVCGCGTELNPEIIGNAAKAVGAAAGLVANEFKIDEGVRNAVVEVLNKARAVMPDEGETFEQAWTPVAEKEISRLVAEKKLTEAQAKIVKAAFGVAVKGLDYLFEVRFPKAKAVKELVVAAADGFIDGFLTVFKPANDGTDAKGTNGGKVAAPAYDNDAYIWLKNQVK